MKKSVIFLLLGNFLLAMACSKESSTTTLKVYMTDAPTNAEEVNIDLQAVRVKFTDNDNAWTDLAAVPGVYNLLGLQNGLDTIVGQGTVPTGLLREIRLVLGSNNTIKIDGQVYPLTIPSGAESGLKIKVNRNLAGPLDSLLIDFDAALSIHEEGTGNYKLRPVLQIK